MHLRRYTLAIFWSELHLACCPAINSLFRTEDVHPTSSRPCRMYRAPESSIGSETSGCFLSGHPLVADVPGPPQHPRLPAVNATRANGGTRDGGDGASTCRLAGSTCRIAASTCWIAAVHPVPRRDAGAVPMRAWR